MIEASTQTRLKHYILFLIFILVGVLTYFVRDGETTGDMSPSRGYEPAFHAVTHVPSIPAQDVNLPLVKDQTVQSVPTPDDWAAALPASLEGTVVDGVLSVNEQGALIVNREIRHLFDYFLAALGEESLETIRFRIKRYLAQSLPQSALPAAEQLLQSYLMILTERATLPSYGYAAAALDRLDVKAVKEHKALVQSINERYMTDPEIEAFFGKENRLDAYTLARIELLQDRSLSEEERAYSLQILSDEFKDIATKTRDNSRTLQTLQDIARHPMDGTSPEEVNQARVRLVGEDAAARLQDLDERRYRWNERLEAWLRERADLIASSSWDEITTQNEIDLQRSRYFSPAELNRVRSLESAIP